MVYEDGVKVKQINNETCVITVEFVPTVPHCSLATLIGKLSHLFTNQNSITKLRITFGSGCYFRFMHPSPVTERTSSSA